MNISLDINLSTYNSISFLRSFKSFIGFVFINVFFLKNTSILSSCVYFVNLGINKEISWITWFINECDVYGLSLQCTMILKKQLQVDYKRPILRQKVNIINEWVCDVYGLSLQCTMILKKQLQVDYKRPILRQKVNIINEWVCDVYAFSYDVNVFSSSENGHKNHGGAIKSEHYGVILTS